MSKKTETARKDARTAGKTAKNNTRRVWRTTTRKGERVLIDPDGHIYHGTAQEVREAALMPFRRKMLADSLRFIRSYAESRGMPRDELAEWARATRRDAIQAGHFDANAPHPLPTVDAETLLMLEAGARLVRDTFDGFMDELLHGELEALLDVAESETGKREIPLTRHERAALERIRRDKVA